MFSVSALFTHNHFEWPAMGMLFALYLVVAKRYEKRRLLNGAENVSIEWDIRSGVHVGHM